MSERDSENLQKIADILEDQFGRGNSDTDYSRPAPPLMPKLHEALFAFLACLATIAIGYGMMKSMASGWGFIGLAMCYLGGLAAFVTAFWLVVAAVTSVFRVLLK